MMNSGKLKLATLGLVVAVLLCLVGMGTPAGAGKNVPVLIGFHGEPDASVIRGAGGTVKRVFNIVPVIAASVPEAAVRGLERNPKVEYVETDRVLHALYQAGETVPWGIDRINVPAVYGLGNSGNGIKVAVLDTGIDAGHPDLAANYVGGHDFVYGDPIPDDENGHGTHVAGTIAAADNGYGIVGAGPRIDLYALKFLDANGSGSTSNEIAAVEWAVNNGIQVLNMSYGSYYRNRSEQRAMDKAYAAGTLLVAAAGNDGNTWKLFPAAYDSVIAVAATDSSNKRAGFSNFYSEVELAAPGVGILSTMPGYFVYLNTYGYSTNYEYLSGTSMATPHVAGTGALVFAQNPAWTNVQVRDQLTSTATDLGAPGRDKEYGYGLVNALAACSGTPPPPPPPAGTGKITGTVYSNGYPAARANVTLYDQSGSTVASMKTDASGTYVFDNLPADEDPATYYVVQARLKKNSATSGALDLQPGQTIVQNLHL